MRARATGVWLRRRRIGTAAVSTVITAIIATVTAGHPAGRLP